MASNLIKVFKEIRQRILETGDISTRGAGRTFSKAPRFSINVRVWVALVEVILWVMDEDYMGMPPDSSMRSHICLFSSRFVFNVDGYLYRE